MQPQGHVQILIGLVDDGLDPQMALDRPRICLTEDYELTNGIVAIEEGISEKAIGELREMGHALELVAGYDRELFGRGQIIRRDPDSGILWGGSDPRSDGSAIGY